MRSRESTDELQAQRKVEQRRAFLEKLRAERQPQADTQRRTKEETSNLPARPHQVARTPAVEQATVLTTEQQRQQEEALATERLQARRLARETAAALQQQHEAEQEQLRVAALLENKRLAQLNAAARIQQEEQAAAQRQQQEARQAEIRAAAAREHQSLVQQNEAAHVQRRLQVKASASQREQEKQQAEAHALALREEQRLALENEAARTQQQAESQAAVERKQQEAQQAEARATAIREQRQLALQSEATRAQRQEPLPPERQSPDRREEIALANARQEENLAQQNEAARRQLVAEERATRLARQQEEQERQRAAAAAQAQEVQHQQLLQEETLRLDVARRERARATSEKKGPGEAALSAAQRSDRQQSAPRQALVARVQVPARIAATSDAVEAAAAQPTDLPLLLRTSGSFILDENGNAVNLRGVTIRGFDTTAPTGGQSFPVALALDDNNLAVMADVWHTNLVRLPFQAQTIVNGNGMLAATDMLSGLDLTVAAIVDGGAYALLSLEPPVGGSTPSAPDANTHQAWQTLALRYQNEPRVLYEIFSSSSPLASNWLQQAATLIDEVRQQNPAAVIFLGSGKGGSDVTGLPLLLPTGEPMDNIVYTIAASTQSLPNPDDGKLRALAESHPVFASIWSDDGSDFGRSSARVADLFGRYGIAWAASNWNADPRLVGDAVNHDFTPTGWGTVAQHALALPAPVLLKDFPAPSSSGANAGIRPLSTNANYVVDDKGAPVTLRGITVRGLDTIAPPKDQTFAAALALDANNLAVITEVWHANLVRLPFQAQTMLSGNGTLSAAEILAGLDLTVASVTAMGAYVLLSLEAPSGGAFAPDATTIQLWQMLADRYKGNHGVLYELVAAISPLSSNWLQFATNLVAAIRQRNSASVIFVGSGKGAADVTGLPLLFATGDPVFNIVYTIAASTQNHPSPDDGNLQALAESYPVFASIWLDDGSDFGRSSARVADLFTRYGIGWAASNWNTEPRLVADAAAHDFAATGWGLTAGRALAQPIKPLLSAFS